MSVVADPCAVLGVAPGSSEREIAAAYRRASLRVHPDRCPGDKEAASKFAKLGEAKDILIRQAQAIASCFPSQAGTPQPQTSVPSAAVAVFTVASPATRAPAPTPAPSHSSQVGSDDVWAKLQAQARAQAAAEAEQAAARRAQQRRLSFVGAGADADTCCSMQSSQPEMPRAIFRGDDSVAHTPSVAKGSKRKACQRDSADPKPQTKKTKAASSPKGKAWQDSAQRKRPYVKKNSGPSKSAKKQFTAEQEHEDEEDDDAEEVGEDEVFDEDDDEDVAGTGGEVESKLEDDVEEETDSDDVEESDQDGAGSEPDEVPCSLRLALDGSDPLAWVGQILADGPCDIPGVDSGARLMLAEMWKHILPELQQVPVQPLHKFHIRTLGMMEDAISRYRDAVACSKNDVAKLAQSATDDDDGRTRDCKRAEEVARSARDTQASEVSDAEAALVAAKASLASAKLAEKATNQEAVKCAAAEKNSEDTRASSQRAVERFQHLEAHGPPAKPAESRQSLKEIENYLAKTSVRENLMGSVLKRVLPALKQKPEQRDRFDQAALSAAEGCLRAHAQEVTEAAASASRVAIAARSRARRAVEAVELARRGVDERGSAIRHARETLKSHVAALKRAAQASRRHARHVAALAAEAEARRETLADAEQAWKSLRSVIDRAATREECAVAP